MGDAERSLGSGCQRRNLDLAALSKPTNEGEALVPLPIHEFGGRKHTTPCQGRWQTRAPLSYVQTSFSSFCA
jgi:hypothetical protein